MSEVLHGTATPVPPPDAGGYQPRHADLLQTHAEQQMRAAEEYRYRQAYKQFRAEYALEFGPYNPDFTPDQTERFNETQRQAVARAAGNRALAANYIDRMGVLAGLREYEGRHRREEQPVHPPESKTSVEPLSDPPIAQETLAYLREQRERALHGPPPEPPPKEAEPQPLDLKPEPAAVESKPTTPEDMALDEPTAEQPAQEPLIKKKRGWSRVVGAWRRAGVAFGLYFNDPEKGKRRQVIAVLGGYALAGTAAWLYGHGPKFGFDDSLWPGSAPPKPPGGPRLTESFFDNLQPTNYHGETYEWGALANQVGPEYATPELLEMVDHARSLGVQVHTWGTPDSGQWGISDVTVYFSDGSHRAYHDTPHKLAILQYLQQYGKLPDTAAGI